MSNIRCTLEERELAKGTDTTSVDDTFWDTLMVETANLADTR
jgi:hypothetical protein